MQVLKKQKKKKRKKKHIKHPNGFWQKFIPFSPILYSY